MTKPPTTTGARAPSTVAQASLYQTLKTHLTVLKLDACAEALPRVLDEAQADYDANPTAGAAWSEVEARLRSGA